MAEEIVAEDTWSKVVFYPEWNSLELQWLPTTERGADADLCPSMERFANEAAARRPSTLIVDVTEFRHRFGEEVMAWRDVTVIPLYNASGAEKMAFIASEDFPGPTVEGGAEPAPDGPANFPTGWFRSRARAYEWLTSET